MRNNFASQGTKEKEVIAYQDRRIGKVKFQKRDTKFFIECCLAFVLLHPLKFSFLTRTRADGGGGPEERPWPGVKSTPLTAATVLCVAALCCVPLTLFFFCVGAQY